MIRNLEISGALPLPREGGPTRYLESVRLQGGRGARPLQAENARKDAWCACLACLPWSSACLSLNACFLYLAPSLPVSPAPPCHLLHCPFTPEPEQSAVRHVCVSIPRAGRQRIGGRHAVGVERVVTREGRELNVNEDGGYVVATGGDDGSISLLSFDGLRACQRAKPSRGKVRALSAASHADLISSDLI